MAGDPHQDSHNLLNTVRSFRDRILAQSQEGRELVAQYYQQGPAMIGMLAVRPKLANKTMGVVLAALPSIEAAVSSGDGSMRLDRAVYDQGQKLIKEYQSVAPSDFRKSLTTLDSFLTKRGRVVGDSIEFNLTDPSVLSKPVVRRTTPVGQATSSDVGGE